MQANPLATTPEPQVPALTAHDKREPLAMTGVFCDNALIANRA